MIALPPRWRRSSDPDRGVLVTARSPLAGASGVVPLIRLEVAVVSGSLHAGACASDTGTRSPGARTAGAGDAAAGAHGQRVPRCHGRRRH